MKARDLSNVLKPYKSGWVIINDKDTVLAHAESLKEIVDILKNIKDKSAVLMPATIGKFGLVG